MHAIVGGVIVVHLVVVRFVVHATVVMPVGMHFIAAIHTMHIMMALAIVIIFIRFVIGQNYWHGIPISVIVRAMMMLHL